MREDARLSQNSAAHACVGEMDGLLETSCFTGQPSHSVTVTLFDGGPGCDPRAPQPLAEFAQFKSDSIGLHTWRVSHFRAKLLVSGEIRPAAAILGGVLTVRTFQSAQKGAPTAAGGSR